ncbi:hypothetical protein B0181_08650 [Moraxella caviae]|uniref:Uncharacterized protein n=1 Tax=Moraxella caviae TaxID=34060 RepID=A0A1S9ZXL3_9GAMM|nr:hypothetical protein B0181_08650 [Moraxella caviae]
MLNRQNHCQNSYTGKALKNQKPLMIDFMGGFLMAWRADNHTNTLFKLRHLKENKNTCQHNLWQVFHMEHF